MYPIESVPGLTRSRQSPSSGRYVNAWEGPVPSLGAVLRFAFSTLFRVGRPTVPEGFRESLMAASSPPPIPSTHPERLRALWLGHACFLVRLPSGVLFITDPVLERRCGPWGLIGPLRVTPAGCSAAELIARGDIDFVVISHAHFDHLEASTVKTLNNSVHWIVPPGLGSWFNRRGVDSSRVSELDWGQRITLSPRGIPTRVTALPCQHWSRRGLFDGNKSLWNSYAVQSDSCNVFFGGDTAYSPAAREIGRVFGHFDLALIGIGAYEPCEIMACSHSNPREAVQMATDLGAKRSIGMHWGTWILSNEPVDEPRAELARWAAAANIDFCTVRINEWWE